MGMQGIIRPPPEIRAVADKTALFVSKNGRTFESRILNSEKGKTPKFAFLHGSSPFHAYYEDRIKFYEQGGTEHGKDDDNDDDNDEKKEPVEEEPRTQEEKGAKLVDTAMSAQGGASEKARTAAAVLDPVARALLAQRALIASSRDRLDASRGDDGEEKGGDEETPEAADEKASSIGPVAPPPKPHYTTLVAPSSLTPAQIEIIKLTAQFTALNGKGGQFLRDLTVKEWSNTFAFGFLQPRHAHFAYFTALVDVYRRILALNMEVLFESRRNGNDSSGSVLSNAILSKMVGRSTDHHIRSDGGFASTNPDSVLNEWKIIETCAGGVQNCLETAAFRAEYDRYIQEKKREEMETQHGSSLVGGAATVDWHDFVVVETIDFPVDEVVEMTQAPPLPSLSAAATKVEKTNEIDESSSESDEDDEDEEQIQVVPDYTPKVVSSQSTANDASRTHIIDPITGRSIPISEMAEHMRIQLMDPKWEAEKKRFLEKQKESNFVEGDIIASNIDRFAKKRGGIFSSSEEKLSYRESDANTRLEEANRIIREQSQMPQPRPHISQALLAQPAASLASAANAIIPPPPPPPPLPVQPLPLTGSATVSTTEHDFDHPKPELDSPSAKKQRVDAPVSSAMLTNVSSTLVSVPPPLSAAPLPVLAPPPASTEPDTETVLLSESDFLATLSDPHVSLSIKIPYDASNSLWNLNDQTISLTIHATAKIKAVKDELRLHLGEMPINKMQLKSQNAGFLKDTHSLAFLNIGPVGTLELVPKVRGGRK